MNTATSTGLRKLQRSRHVCMNPSGLVGLEFHFFPILLPLSGHKAVLSDETIRSSNYKTILAMLFFGSLLYSSNFYWVHHLRWARWYILQKQDELILNFCMFVHRKTQTVIYRQLCQNGNYGFRPTHLLVCDPFSLGSLQTPFKDMWLSPTLWCLQGRLQLPHTAKGSIIRLLHWNQHREYHSLCANSHPAGSGRKKRHPMKMSYTRTPTGVIIVNYVTSLCENNHHHCKHFKLRQSYSETALSVLASLINSPADKPQVYSELIHCIQQQVIASSWQHRPSTSATSLEEISPGWQKTASNGMFRTFLFSAVIRIKS